jgi:hypothetical protein
MQQGIGCTFVSDSFVSLAIVQPSSPGSPFAGEQEIEDMIAELDAQKAGDLAS